MRPTDATEATRVSLSAPFKATPPVFGLHAAVQEWKTHGPGQRRAGWPVGQAPPRRGNGSHLHGYSHRTGSTGKGTRFYLHTTDVMGLITAEVLETMSLYKMLVVHPNSCATLDPPMPH